MSERNCDHGHGEPRGVRVIARRDFLYAGAAAAAGSVLSAGAVSADTTLPSAGAVTD